MSDKITGTCIEMATTSTQPEATGAESAEEVERL